MSLISLSNCAITNKSELKKDSFENEKPVEVGGLSNTWEIVKAYIKANRKAPMPESDLPVHEFNIEQFTNQDSDTMVKLGHSSLMFKVSGNIVLLDPVFSERASPVQWAGPKRFHQPPISISDIPDVDVVVISHDHYDHLDKDSIKKLAAKTKHFVVPKSVGEYLKNWGVKKDKITELDWWQGINIGGVDFIATPTQHFSGRGLFDRNSTLWASWVIKGRNSNIFFSGDSGYFKGFKEIGEKYGPFDVTFVETGAYNELWKDIHMTPEESVQAHIDLKGKVMIPIHNGTFDLALHDWYEPLERVSSESQKRNVILSTPVFGRLMSVKKPELGKKWWRPFIVEESGEAVGLVSE